MAWPFSTPADRIVERFTLRAARAVAVAEGEPQRACRAAVLEAARQRARAADALFCDGRRAEATRLLAEALETTLAVVDEARHAALLAARGIAIDRLRALAEALRAAPDLEDGVRAIDVDVFQRALGARRRLADALMLASLAPRDLDRRRLRRGGALVAVVLAAIALPFVPIPELTRVRVWASGQWAYDAHFPEDALDGDPATEWHGTNQQAGWLDIRVSPPQHVERLRFLNGHNPPFDDRGCGVVILRVYRRGEQVAAFNRRFSTVEHAPEWVVFEVGEDGIDRIRVDVPVFHRMGPAIAEVGWE